MRINDWSSDVCSSDRQCETTQNREHGTGASFFGYSKLYGQVPGGQAEMLRVPFGNFLPVKVPHEHEDDRFLFLSDVLPTAWQGLKYAAVPDGGTLLVMGAGPIGDRSEEHTSELQSLMRISYAVFCLTKTRDMRT